MMLSDNLWSEYMMLFENLLLFDNLLLPNAVCKLGTSSDNIILSANLLYMPI
jgi:hypothetical protein